VPGNPLPSSWDNEGVRQRTIGGFVSRVLTIVGTSALAILGYIGTSAASQPSERSSSQPVVSDCGGTKPFVRPTAFNPNGQCSGTPYLPHDLVWHTWTARQAIATGRVTVQICVPDCASGSEKNLPATVRLWGESKARGRDYFTYVTFAFSSASGQGTRTEPLFVLCKYSKPPCDPRWPPPHAGSTLALK
jgi:hypothetical protein